MEGGHWCEQDFIFIFFLANDDLWKNKWPQVTCVETLIPVEMNYEVGIAEARAQWRPPCSLGPAPDLWPQGMAHTLFSFAVQSSTPSTISLVPGGAVLFSAISVRIEVIVHEEEPRKTRSSKGKEKWFLPLFVVAALRLLGFPPGVLAMARYRTCVPHSVIWHRWMLLRRRLLTRCSRRLCHLGLLQKSDLSS